VSPFAATANPSSPWGELADALQPRPPGAAAARSKRDRPVVQVTVSTDDARHQVQDLQSLALHEEAIRLARSGSMRSVRSLISGPMSRDAGGWGF
jgi:hypothetical protein